MDSRDKGYGEKRRKGVQFTTTSPYCFASRFIVGLNIGPLPNRSQFEETLKSEIIGRIQYTSKKPLFMSFFWAYKCRLSISYLLQYVCNPLTAFDSIIASNA